MEGKEVQNRNSKKWLEDLSKGLGHEPEAIALEGLKVVKIQKGYIRCNFVVTNRISDADRNWHVGAMATLIDNVGAAAIFSLAGHVKEEVELEAKVIGDMGRITAVLIEVRRKGNGELIALGKQWMASHFGATRASMLFNELSRASKL